MWYSSCWIRFWADSTKSNERWGRSFFRPLFGNMEQTWKLYILRCADHTFYTGITVDVAHRFAMHQSGKGAKYTRGRGPLELVYMEECGTHSDALQREIAVKKLSRQEKMKLIENNKPGIE